tara:strand:+ start:463 stop:1875 length:1413 start_codon:yes stop_codon:yes gene_type:complete
MAKKIQKGLETQSDKINRGRELSRRDDVVKNKTIGLMDIDSALFYYFENVIKPEVKENGEQVKVPVIYANPERWAAIQRQGFLRDAKRKIIVPVIAFKRTSLAKDDSLSLDKIDPLQPKLYQTYQSRFTQENRYDKLTATKGITPKKEMFSVAVPDYVTVNYDFTIWTSYTDQMNAIVETINWSEGSYWGEPGKFRFRASIDSFDDQSEYEDNRRNIKTTFSVTIKGYLIPDSFNDVVTTQKFITPKQIVINDETNLKISTLANIDDEGAKTIKVITGGQVGGGGGGSLAGQLKLSAGSNLSFDEIIFDGTSTVNRTLALDNNPIISGNLAVQGNISGSATTTGSFGRIQVSTISGQSPLNIDVGTDGLGIQGKLSVTGSIVSTEDIITSGNIIAEQYIVSSSITFMTQSFSSGSTIFGDTQDDVHQFTGSMSTSGSFTNTGDINASGRIFEQGSSVIDHATAMAIVFGG